VCTAPCSCKEYFLDCAQDMSWNIEKKVKNAYSTMDRVRMAAGCTGKAWPVAVESTDQGVDAHVNRNLRTTIIAFSNVSAHDDHGAYACLCNIVCLCYCATVARCRKRCIITLRYKLSLFRQHSPWRPCARLFERDELQAAVYSANVTAGAISDF
jgi:hypothetical protein